MHAVVAGGCQNFEVSNEREPDDWQAVLVRASARLLKRALSETDERSKLEGELVSGIEVVKCSAWEVRADQRGLHGIGLSSIRNAVAGSHSVTHLGWLCG